MKEQKIRKPSIITMLFLSWFYTGKLSKAPGTIGSLATLPLIYLLHYLEINLPTLISIIFGLFILSVLVTENVQKKYQLHDPQWIVIDEVLGMLITWSFVRTVDFPTLFLVFSVFRFFDIVKIWPASFFDKLHHGVGTITDDVISALYSGIIIIFIQKFL